uniref:Uncharacterized protein n=1 Tax=Physcomitrium patens TaxID=3218 RepID=A0A7I4ERU5_PHYPA
MQQATTHNNPQTLLETLLIAASNKKTLRTALHQARRYYSVTYNNSLHKSNKTALGK